MQNFSDFLNSLGSSDLQSLIIILDAYNSDSKIRKNDIEDIGFNNQTGYVWLSLSNGISICSNFGQDAIFYKYDFQGEECEFDTYEEAFNYEY